MSVDPATLATLRRITTNRPRPQVGERCEMCAEPIREKHQHVVDLESRALMCTCRGCYLLFTAQDADLRFRAVPDRHLSFGDFALGPGQWDALEIPVGLAFFFRNSQQDRTIAFYPGPAGATESELPLEAWQTVLAANPGLCLLAPDVEALLIRVADRADSGAPVGAHGGAGPYASCHLVPIDACYELIGRLRRVWRGFDGGSDARAELARFFATVDELSRPAGVATGRPATGRAT